MGGSDGLDGERQTRGKGEFQSDMIRLNGWVLRGSLDWSSSHLFKSVCSSHKLIRCTPYVKKKKDKKIEFKHGDGGNRTPTFPRTTHNKIVERRETWEQRGSTQWRERERKKYGVQRID